MCADVLCGKRPMFTYVITLMCVCVYISYVFCADVLYVANWKEARRACVYICYNINVFIYVIC